MGSKVTGMGWGSETSDWNGDKVVALQLSNWQGISPVKSSIPTLLQNSLQETHPNLQFRAPIAATWADQFS